MADVNVDLLLCSFADRFYLAKLFSDCLLLFHRGARRLKQLTLKQLTLKQLALPGYRATFISADPSCIKLGDTYIQLRSDEKITGETPHDMPYILHRNGAFFLGVFSFGPP